MTALRAACEKLVEAIDRREVSSSAMMDRRRALPYSATLAEMREWPEHEAWRKAIADEIEAQNAIRAALAEETTPAHAFRVGDRVRVKDGSFVGMSGTVESFDNHPVLPINVLIDGRISPLGFSPSELSPAEGTK